jgi:hypothetical protein
MGRSSETERLTAVIGAVFAITVMTCLLTLVLAMIDAVFPNMLGGAGGADPNHLRNFLELLYFATNSAVAAAVWVALRFARAQATHALQQNQISVATARATIYLELSREFASDRFKQGLGLCNPVRVAFEAQTAADKRTMSLPAFGSREVNRWRINDPERFALVIDLLASLENLGLLIRREYLSLDDVYFFLEGPLKDIDEVFGGFLREGRAASPKQRAGEHAVWLLTMIWGHRPKSTLLGWPDAISDPAAWASPAAPDTAR